MENSLAGEATATARRGEVVSTYPVAFGSVTPAGSAVPPEGYARAKW